jgi:hypothetical protein
MRLSYCHVTGRAGVGNELATHRILPCGPVDGRAAKFRRPLRRCGNMALMATWKLVTLAFKAQRGWSRIPAAQRRKILENAGKQARKHGPTVAKRVGEALRQTRKGR